MKVQKSKYSTNTVFKLNEGSVEFKSYKNKFTVSSHKLLIQIISLLASNDTNKEKIRPDVDVSIRNYCSLCGGNSNNKTEIDNFRKKLKKDISIIGDMLIKPNKSVPFDVIDSYSHSKGYYHIKLTDSFIDYLKKHNTMATVPDSLFRLDERNRNAYAIALKLI